MRSKLLPPAIAGLILAVAGLLLLRHAPDAPIATDAPIAHPGTTLQPHATAPDSVATATAASSPHAAATALRIAPADNATSVLQRPGDPRVLRARRIEVPARLVSGQPLARGEVIEFALFDDVTIRAEVATSSTNVNGTVSTTAHAEDSSWGRACMASTEGRFRARIRTPGQRNGIYAIEYDRGLQAYCALQLDAARVEPDEGPDDARPTPAAMADTTATPDAPAASTTALPQAMADESVASTVCDVMVVYSDDARAAAGSTAEMNNIIAIGMAFTNDAHANTNTGIVLRLAYSYELNYTETGDNGTDLCQVTPGYPGYTHDPSIDANRTAYGADFVQFINTTGGGGGISWQLTYASGDAKYAYSVVTDISYESYTPAHEMGHNMGVHHAADQLYQPGPTGGTIGTDAAGWHWHPTPGAPGYATIMTYLGGYYYADSLGHARVGIFSDPNITSEGGFPAGNLATANNARVLRALKGVYAGYRTRSTAATAVVVESPNGGELLSAGDTCRIFWRTGTSVTGDMKVELYKGGALDRVLAASTPNDRIFAWTVPADIAGGTDYAIRVSSVSNPARADMSDANFSIQVTIYENNLDANPGWTITGAGGWAYGTPGGNNSYYGGPATAYTGTNIYDTVLTGICFASTTLTTQAIDCSGFQTVHLEFMGQFAEVDGDTAKVQVSTNGTTWTDLFSATDFFDYDWTPYAFDITEQAAGKATVYIRWSRAEGNSYSSAGMAIDDVRLSGLPAPTPLETWRQTWFGTTAPTGNAANDADPDHDGIANLLEYAISGSNPTVPSPAPTFTATTATSPSDGLVHARVSFAVSGSTSGVTLSVEFAPDVAGPWMPVTTYTTAAGLRTYEDPQPLPTGASRFFRIMVTPL